ncbi:MAG: hypothetical protein P8P88_00745 [Polaribacter sp.]|nr:hypothetical protein [Polaribacter sp.]
MKKFILLFIIISSCSNKIDKKDLQGNWFWYYHENDNNNLIQINIKNDSIILVDYFFLPKKGVYSLKNDTIKIRLKDEILKKRISLTDTSLILNSTSFQKSDYLSNEKYEEIGLINLKSENKINAFELSKYQGSFLLLKENDSIKIKLWNNEVSFEEYINSVPIHFDRIGYVALLGDNLKLRDLKIAFLQMYYYNFGSIGMVTKTNFQNYNYDVYFVRKNVWKKEVDKYSKENGLEKREIPHFTEDYSKEKFIELNNPNLIEIKTKNDFAKLEETKANSTYLISINIALSVEEYLLLKQKINKIEKENNLKIRTEIISF